jgi:hypothetical protein
MKSRAGLKDFLRPNARMRNQQIEGADTFHTAALTG